MKNAWEDATQFEHHAGWGVRPRNGARGRVFLDGKFLELEVIGVTKDSIRTKGGVPFHPTNPERWLTFRARKDGSWRLVGSNEILELL